jgi:hypothetical protein
VTATFARNSKGSSVSTAQYTSHAGSAVAPLRTRGYR